MAGKYTSYTPLVKAKIAIEAAGNQKTINQIASEHAVSPAQVAEWKKQLLEEAEVFFQNKRRRKTVEAHVGVEC